MWNQHIPGISNSDLAAGLAPMAGAFRPKADDEAYSYDRERVNDHAKEKLLFDAIENGRKDELRRLISEGVNIHASDYDGDGVLHRASERGRLDIVELLVENGAKVRASGEHGNTPLHDAAIYGHADIVQFLVENKADINAANDWGWTPLHYASFRYPNVVSLLLDSGADIFTQNKHGYTPLETAHNKNRPDIVELLETAARERGDHESLYQVKERLNAAEEEKQQKLLDEEEKRIQEGLCPKCGKAKTHRVGFFFRTRLTIEGQSRNGECLLCDPSDPSRWAISYNQLMIFHKEASETFGTDYPNKTMHHVVQEMIAPKCVKKGKSYALQCNPQGLKLDVFVTHAWDEPFEQFVESIKQEYGSNLRPPNLWICSFALRQGDSQSIAEELDGDLLESPFVKAMKEATSYLVVRNHETDVFTRIWCVCEVMFGRKFGLIPEKASARGPKAQSTSKITCLDAQATNPEDRDKIVLTLLNEHKREDIDTFIHELRIRGL